MTPYDRRSFLQKALVTSAAIFLPLSPAHAVITIDTIKGRTPLKKRTVKRALVAWYSQTGNTERIGALLAKTLEKSGVEVISSDMRGVDPSILSGMDLMIIGSPVFYYDTPDYVKRWIDSLPNLPETPVASYVTFGGPEGNQHNAACSILSHFVEKGALPVGLNAFMNMSTFPLGWSEKKVHHKTWMSRHLPDEETYAAARAFASDLVRHVEEGGRDTAFSKKLTLREMVTVLHPIWWTKLAVKNHGIDREVCIGCGVCAEKCPAGAIDIREFTIDRKACELCFGCINNCPVQAVTMTYNGEKVFGYGEFMKRKNLKITEPEELKTPSR